MRTNGHLDAAKIVIRRLGDGDREAVRRLAGRDTTPVPTGALLGLEADGRLLAVAPLGGGRTIADPFLATAGARAMLELRVAQLEPSGRRRGWPLRRRRPRASLAGSPPGAGGRLLTLLPRSRHP